MFVYHIEYVEAFGELQPYYCSCMEQEEYISYRQNGGMWGYSPFFKLAEDEKEIVRFDFPGHEQY